MFHISHFILSIDRKDYSMHFNVNQNSLSFENHFNLIDVEYEFNNPEINLTIFYYDLNRENLFKGISDIVLKNAMITYYTEAERALKAECWLSYGLMVGSLIESYLLFKLNKKNGNLNCLINTAKKQKIIDEDLYLKFHYIKDFRNYTHPNKLKKIERNKALFALNTLEKELFFNMH